MSLLPFSVMWLGCTSLGTGLGPWMGRGTQSLRLLVRLGLVCLGKAPSLRGDSLGKGLGIAAQTLWLRWAPQRDSCL